MTKTQKWERAAAIAVPLLLMIALAVTGVWGSRAQAEADALKSNMQELYRASFYELEDNVSDMGTALKKLFVVSSKSQHILLLGDVWRLSGAAGANLADLPLSHADTEGVTRFITQSGDFAHALTRRILNGEVISEQDREQLYDLYEASVSVSGELTHCIEAEDMPVETVDVEGYYAVSEAENAEDGAAQSAEATPETSPGAQPGAEKNEDSSSNYPTLIYDGPFSDSTQKQQPLGLPAGQISSGDAAVAALTYLGQGAQLVPGERSEGAIPAYHFTGTDPDGRAVEIAISQQGGQVVWMMAETAGREEGVPAEDVTARYKAAAKAYLDARGYDDMQATYAEYYAGVAVLNFASTQDGVLLYSDLVKVYVERRSEKVVGVDANNYLFSHTTRTFPDALISEDAARHSVSDDIEIMHTAMALIPTDANREVLCYEFKGTCRGAEFIVYINAENGTEEDVFEIINAEEGQLVV